ncbi:MAG TPA: hypothetical protein VHU90_11295, partial [Galbitalea sp.]|nr:hypothetical protein [Galbitalea sp.]
MSNEDELLNTASDPETPQATLADLAYDHPELRSAIALNPSTYSGLLKWLGELRDPEVDAALSVRARGTKDASESNVLRLGAPVAPTVSLAEVLAVSPSRTATEAIPSVSPEPPVPALSRRPAFLTPRFAIVAGSLVILAVVGIIVTVSVQTAALHAKEAADSKAAQVSADKANGPTAKTPHVSATPTAIATPVPVAPPNIVPSGFSQTWRQGFVATGGYTETVAVSVGTPEAVGSAYPRMVSTGVCEDPVSSSGGCLEYQQATFTGGKTCDTNKATDAVIPISVDTTSTTSAFSQKVGAGLSFESGSTLQYEAYYNTGAVCNDGSNGYLSESSLSTNSLKDGQGSSLPMFLIIENYYTPDHPNGDPSLLADIRISVTGSTTSSTSWAGDGNPVTYQSAGSPSSTLSPGSALQLG